MMLVSDIVIYAFAAVFGACVFSFLNVLIYRVPRKLNWVSGRSMCPQCEHALAPKDLVPVFSWLFLRGKCRYCGAPIRARYTAVELLGAVCALFCLCVWGPTLATVFGFALCALMTTVAFIDHDTREIPNGLVVATAVLGALALVIELVTPSVLPGAVFPAADVTWLDRVIGVFAASVPLLLVALLTGGFGGGDIKLMAALGLALGWKLTLLTLFGGIVLGGIYAICLLVSKRAGAKDAFAFGPFLCLCAIISSAYGNGLIQSYLGLFGLG